MHQAVEYTMRVKMPNSAHYLWHYDGENKYDEICRKTILDSLPPGYEVNWPTRQTWPVDKDGMTWVSLYCSDEKNALAYWMKEAHYLQSHLTRIKKAVGV